MQKMLVQVKLNFFMTDTAMEKGNYTARNLLSFRSAYYLPTNVLSNQLINKRIYQPYYCVTVFKKLGPILELYLRRNDVI